MRTGDEKMANEAGFHRESPAPDPAPRIPDPGMIRFPASCASQGKEVTTMTMSAIRKAAAAGMAVALTVGSTTAFAQEIRVLNAGSTHTWRAQVYAGVPVGILVNGDGDTDLDLYVRTPSGRLIAVDDDYTDTCIVQFVPSFTGTVTIEIVNRGSVWNRYSIGMEGGFLR